MNKNSTQFSVIVLFISFIAFPLLSQPSEILRQKLLDIVSTKNAEAGISIMGEHGKDTLSINGGKHFPLQSVFKFHIALKVLSEIDRGTLTLDQRIEIKPSELLPGLYSPLREKYPQGATLPISEILRYTVSQSDNVGCDVLLRLLGGPAVVEDYFLKNNFHNIAIKINEEVMQNNWDLQFLNWTTPKSANEILAAFYDNDRKFLSAESHEFIWRIMMETETGQQRLKGQLPKGTPVAHKTGWSGTNKEGITAAVNDIGIVFLPNGSHFFISVFVTNSKEDGPTNERIIAEVSKAAWDYFNDVLK